MSLTADEALEKAGSFGWYQFRLYCIISYAIFFSSLVLMVMTFSTAEPPWRCVANETVCNLTGTYKPGDQNYDFRCNIDRSHWEFAVDGDFDSIVTEWDLVCDKAVYVSIANSMTFLVWMFGAMVASVLSDKYGRKAVTFPCTVFASLCGLISAFASKYWVFALFRGLTGAGIGGYSICGFVLMMEYIGVRHRSVVGIGIWFPWIFSLWTLALVAYLVPNWRTLTIITSAPGLLFFIFWKFTPKSLRWLLVKGKYAEATKTLHAVANGNGKVVEDDAFNFSDENENKNQLERLGDIRDLFATRSMTHKTLVTWYCWAVSGLVYYGIILSSTTIGGNMYLNFFLSAVFELIGMFIAIPSLNRFGRKKSIVVGLYVAALAAITAAVLNLYDDGSTGFLVGKIITAMMIAKFCITITFDGVYVYSSELFPTVVRNTAMGSSTSAARVGSFCAPFIVYSKRIHTMMPFGIMAINALICGVLCMTLPETNKKPLPDTLQQAVKSEYEKAAKVEDNGLARDDQKLFSPTMFESVA